MKMILERTVQLGPLLALYFVPILNLSSQGYILITIRILKQECADSLCVGFEVLGGQRSVNLFISRVCFRGIGLLNGSTLSKLFCTKATKQNGDVTAWTHLHPLIKLVRILANLYYS
ncbi:uncharacterized protein LOC111273243 [Varroa jacobsoni]|uniref:uncharacterized protein LOC111273243 n=1 Tax=Varroa jacobsoni TaxID=62625 RepID=UPI000BF28E53|nr:uncharacterized protein LOC111273243 [Varroa jacobsoni]